MVNQELLLHIRQMEQALHDDDHMPSKVAPEAWGGRIRSFRGNADVFVGERERAAG
jgi:hypothetical protein